MSYLRTYLTGEHVLLEDVFSKHVLWEYMFNGEHDIENQMRTVRYYFLEDIFLVDSFH